MTELCRLAEKYRSDKCPSIHHTYTPVYQKLLEGRDVRKMLEIGIGSPTTMPNTPGYVAAAGLKMWADFFPQAEIYGIDIAEDSLVNEGRIHSYICRQDDPEDLKKFAESVGGDFDLIIDDGSHDKDHQILSARILMPYVKAMGIYIIEDVEFLEYVGARLSFPQEHYVGPRVGCGVSDNTLIIMRKS